MNRKRGSGEDDFVAQSKAFHHGCTENTGTACDAGDGQVFDQKGIPLDFENEQPGHDISDHDAEPCIIFDDDDLNEYNAAVGISLEVYQEYDEGWINLVRGRVAQEQTGDERRPWWKFW